MRHRKAVPGRFRAVILGLALATLLPAVVYAAEVCTTAIEHPVSVTVTALDPIQRGASVRFLVRASSRVGLGRAEARLTNAGKALVAGSNRVTLGRLERGKTREATFRVVLPNSGERTLVQFKVIGEGPNGVLARGAAYNVLPDGPTEHLTKTAQGTLDAPARRIDR